MLSRVAERVYWMARYVERAECTARLVNAYTTQLMDLPKGVEPGWDTLVRLIGADASFQRLHSCYDEPNTIQFLLADAEHPSSIMSALAMARENVRTTRDILPTEAWEYANELYLYGKNNVQQAIGRRNRFYFLKNVILRCQQITGLLAGTMSHDAAYRFVRIGRKLERADMTTRIVDSAASLLMPRRDRPGEWDSILWVSVLKSLSAYQMYRQHVRHRVAGDAVVRFLLTDPEFPRSVAHALGVCQACLATLPRHEAALRSLARVRARIDAADVGALGMDPLHRLIDEVQNDLSEVHAHVRATWFDVERPTAQQQVQSG